MAIQFRGGAYEDFVPSKLLNREPAVIESGDPATISGQSVKVKIGDDIHTFVTKEELDETVADQLDAELDDYTADLLADITAAEQAATDAASAANTAKTGADNAATAANNAKTAADEAAASANNAATAANTAAANANAYITLIARTETSPAQAAHSVGEYIIYNTALYRVTSAIAIGDTLTVDTNITATTIADALETIDPSQISAMQSDISKLFGDFATVEASTTASQAYKAGEYLIYNGYLYRVTTAISSGGTITVGTNVVQTTVGEKMSNRTLWYKEQAVSATTGNIVTISDSRITTDHVLSEVVWDDSSKITAITGWSTDTPGTFTINGTCTAATTVTVILTKKDN